MLNKWYISVYDTFNLDVCVLDCDNYLLDPHMLMSLTLAMTWDHSSPNKCLRL